MYVQCRCSNSEGQNRLHKKGSTVPQVTIRTLIDGREETLSEYMCDWPDCPNVAVHEPGMVRELRFRSAMCEEHATQVTNQGRTTPTDSR
jgi:hypothetical protein